MPTLEPIVVNPPKEKKTYTYSENDIVDIVAQAIKQGKIEAGAGFEEVVLDIYLNDLDLGHGFLVNEEKIAIVSAILEKAKKNKLIIGKVELPDIDREGDLSIHGRVFGTNNFSNNDDFKADSGFSFGNERLLAGAMSVAYDGQTVILPVLGSSQVTNYKNLLMQKLASDPTACIHFEIRVEK